MNDGGGVREARLEYLTERDLIERNFTAKRGSELSEAGLFPEKGIIGSLLRDAIARLNPELGRDKAAVEQVVRVLRSPPHTTFIENNR